MHTSSSAWRSLWAFAAVLVLACCCLVASPVWADQVAEAVTYRCDATLLRATLHSGAVDDPTTANASAGTLPGAFVVLEGPELSLQLPRTNNAGPPSFTDGKWWWSLEDPSHPRFLQRRGLGDIQSFDCTVAT